LQILVSSSKKAVKTKHISKKKKPTPYYYEERCGGVHACPDRKIIDQFGGTSKSTQQRGRPSFFTVQRSDGGCSNQIKSDGEVQGKFLASPKGAGEVWRVYKTQRGKWRGSFGRRSRRKEGCGTSGDLNREK